MNVRSSALAAKYLSSVGINKAGKAYSVLRFESGKDYAVTMDRVGITLATSKHVYSFKITDFTINEKSDIFLKTR